MYKVYDNWLDKNLVEYLEDYFLYNFPHYYGHSSNNDNQTCFYNSILNPNDALNNFLFYKLQQTLKLKLQLERMYINIQHPNMDGSFHTDDGDITCLYMATKTRKENDGAFQIKGLGKTQFVQNRLVCFDANKMHRGLAPDSGVRITLAFKCRKI